MLAALALIMGRLQLNARRGDAHHRQLTGAIQARQFRRVVLVVFALHPRPLRNQRRRDHVTRITPLAHGAVEHIPRTTRLVTRAHLAVLGHPREHRPQFRKLIRIAINPRRLRRALGQYGDGHRLLVDIEARYTILGTAAEDDMGWSPSSATVRCVRKWRW